jgi:hypothetical protein
MLFAICYIVIALLFSLLNIRDRTNFTELSIIELSIIMLRISRLSCVVILESSCTSPSCRHMCPATPPIATSGETSYSL